MVMTSVFAYYVPDIQNNHIEIQVIDDNIFYYQS